MLPFRTPEWGVEVHRNYRSSPCVRGALKGGNCRKQNGECRDYVTESPAVGDVHTGFIGGSGEREAGRTGAI